MDFEPRHHIDTDEPCEFCGARWENPIHGTGLVMEHSPDCLWMNELGEEDVFSHIKTEGMDW